MPQDDMTTAQAAQRLGVHIKTITRWVEDERLTPSMKFPGPTGGYLFAHTEVERLAAELLQEVEAKAKALRGETAATP
jgi:excisionase family DNA binding protein